MARIEDLIDEIADQALREKIARQVKLIKSTKRFGLVFEEHVPETVSLHGLPIRPGSIVQNRRKLEDTARLQILSVEGDKATISPIGLDESVEVVDIADLLVVKAFEEPIFPGLTPLGEVRLGPEGKSTHTVISGENFHALQLLAYTHAGLIDVIYIDPPYNTGARDWKYNNRFVDNNDTWRHSKWLAMMEKRLRLCRKLLKPDGVLIVTIDDKEVHRLGLVLKEVFIDARIEMITSVINPRGKYRANEFARCEEYIFFVMLGSAVVQGEPDADYSESAPVAWRTFRRSDVTSARGTPKGGKEQFYPIYVDSNGKIEKIGKPLPHDVPRSTAPAVSDCSAVFPIRDDGTEMNWGLTAESAQRLLEKGYLRVGRATPKKPQTYEISYLTSGRIADIETGRATVVGYNPDGSVIARYVTHKIKMPVTTWNRPSHNAEVNGTELLKALLGDKSFPYPKSLYAVADALRFFVANNPEAVIMDFFAGSGTTLHAVALLNAQDGGSRRCILVTNNDVSDADANRLYKSGYFSGDPEFESQGIFESVTKPRVEAAITGIKPDGKPVEGKYLDQYLPDHAHADGFAENAVFLRMDYLEPDLVELGRQYNAIAPLLWMAAGSAGSWEEWDDKKPWSAPANSKYAVLFDLVEAAGFGTMVESRPEITHAWIVTDSHSGYVEASADLPSGVRAGQLYREYLRNFTINAPGVLD